MGVILVLVLVPGVKQSQLLDLSLGLGFEFDNTNTYFGWCLRAIINPDIFEKLTPTWVFKIPKLKLETPHPRFF